MGPIIFIIIFAFVAISIFLSFVPLGLWISALASGVHVSWATLIGMKIRRIQPKRLVEPLIKARKAGLNLTLSQLETHYLAGGNVDRVINALIVAIAAKREKELASTFNELEHLWEEYNVYEKQDGNRNV